MYIIADVEWAVNHSHKNSPTQLAAVRVDENWEIVEDFFSYIRPMNSSFYDWDHVAYAGATPTDFKTAPSCYDVFESFNNWVGEDTICWWFKTSADIHTFVNKIVLKTKTPKECIILGDYMPGFFNGEGVVKGGSYKIAKSRNISVPSIEHNSWNDVMAILYLFRATQFPQSSLAFAPIKPAPKTSKPQDNELEYHYDVKNEILHKKGCLHIAEDAEILGFGSLKTPLQKKFKPCECVRAELRQAKRARVIDEINRTHYTFMHTEHSNVFHRYDCGLLHNADHVVGSVKYETIARKGLRPCRVCNPSPNDTYRPVVYEQKLKVMKTKILAKHGLKKSVITAINRHEQAQREREAELDTANMTSQERDDLFTLTQPRFAFFVGKGYQKFHTRNCPCLRGVSNIKGFRTYEIAKKAGYNPCKRCKPTTKQNILASIPYESKVREDETIQDLHQWCSRYGYEHKLDKDQFSVLTPVGKWIIHTEARPVTVDHINLAQRPDCETYHKQHRIFLSMLDALKYIYRHDRNIILNPRSITETSISLFKQEVI